MSHTGSALKIPSLFLGVSTMALQGLVAYVISVMSDFAFTVCDTILFIQ